MGISAKIAVLMGSSHSYVAYCTILSAHIGSADGAQWPQAPYRQGTVAAQRDILARSN